MFAYRLGLPCWKLYARLGGPIRVRVDVILDEDTGMLVATSPDLRGLVCESDTVNKLKSSVEAAAYALLERRLKSRHPLVADMRLLPA